MVGIWGKESDTYSIQDTKVGGVVIFLSFILALVFSIASVKKLETTTQTSVFFGVISHKSR